jgi:hypothetical protein
LRNRIAAAFDRWSGYLFLIGYVTAKLRYLPFGLMAGIFNLVSILTYLAGYLSWYVAALLYTGHTRRHERWFGFAELNFQYEITALLGTIASIMAIICIAAPVLIVPTAWIFAISNLLWAISEHHKNDNPMPDDITFSSKRHTHYLRYATLSAISSTIMAVGLTLGLLIPPVAVSLVAATTITAAIITVVSLYYWGRHAFGSYKPDRVSHSYEKLADGLGCELTHNPLAQPSPSPRLDQDATYHSLLHPRPTSQSSPSEAAVNGQDCSARLTTT